MNQNSLFLILAAPACAWVAGMGLFKTLLVLAIMHRWVPGGEFSGPLEVVGSNTFLAVAGTLAAIEVIVDYIPRWDIAWDRWTAHLRFAGAAVLSWLVLYSEPVDSRITMAVVGVVLAITSFTAKSAARKAAIRGNTASIVTPVSSTTENCMIFATLLPLTKLPPMTLLMVAFMAMAAMLIMFVIRREARETLQWVLWFRWTPAGASETAPVTESAGA